MKAKNLTLRGSTIRGIHKVVPHDPTVFSGSDSAHLANWDDIYDVHYSGNCLGEAAEVDLANPQQKVGLEIRFGAASAINRRSQSEALLFDEEIYYMQSWTDLFGTSGSRAPACKRGGRLVKFARKCTNEEHFNLILGLQLDFGQRERWS
jgi:hypothetical protein